MTRSETKQRIEELEFLPVLHKVAQRILARSGREFHDEKGLAALVAVEPSLTAHVLRAANARQGVGRAPFASVGKAVACLGSEEVRRLVLNAALSPESASGKSRLDRVTFWQHSVACGICAERIACRINSPYSEEAFVAGLLHDIGRLALDLVAPDDYAAVLDLMRNEHLFVLEAERRKVGVDHVLAGKWLGERWGLPESLVNAIWLHHHPAGSIGETEFAVELVEIVNLANVLTQGRFLGVPAEVTVPPFPSALMERLGLNPLVIKNIYTELLEALQSQFSQLSLDKEESPDPFLESRVRSELVWSGTLAEVENRTLRRKANRFRTLHQMNLKLRPGQPFAKVFAIATESIRKGLDVSQGLCLVVDHGGEFLHVKMWRPGADSAEDLVLSMSQEAPDDRAVLPPQILEVLKEIALGKGEGGWIGAALTEVVRKRSLVIVPMFAAGKSVGQIVFDVEASTLDLSDDGLSEVLAFAGACGLALARCQAEMSLIQRTEELAAAIWKKELANQQLLRAERLASVGKMAAGAAHEINNPLAVISGRAQILLARAEDPETIKALDIIVNQSRRASKILTDLMQFARPALPKLAPTLVNFVLHQVMTMFVDRFDGKGIKVVEEYTEGLPRALLDKHQIEQVIVNLLLNAEHAMREGGGTLTLRTGATADRHAVTIELADTGHGIPADVIPHIFEPFYTTKGEGEGTGLGLSVCHGIVEGHRGAITVVSEVGKGTTFTIVLPSATDLSMHRAATDETQEAVRGERKTILVVDDDADLRELLKESLQNRGYAVKTAANGMEAIDAMASGLVDLVLLDIRMPTLDGLAVLSELGYRFSSVPVIVITGLASHEEVEQALKLGARSCLRKPFELERLLAEVELILAEKA